MDKSIDMKKNMNLIIPADRPLSETQLIAEIEKAEKGSFITVEEGMKDFEQWLQARERK
jgi:hypothetical protein